MTDWVIERPHTEPRRARQTFRTFLPRADVNIDIDNDNEGLRRRVAGGDLFGSGKATLNQRYKWGSVRREVEGVSRSRRSTSHMEGREEEDEEVSPSESEAELEEMLVGSQEEEEEEEEQDGEEAQEREEEGSQVRSWMSDSERSESESLEETDAMVKDSHEGEDAFSIAQTASQRLDGGEEEGGHDDDDDDDTTFVVEKGIAPTRTISSFLGRAESEASDVEPDGLSSSVARSVRDMREGEEEDDEHLADVTVRSERAMRRLGVEVDEDDLVEDSSESDEQESDEEEEEQGPQVVEIAPTSLEGDFSRTTVSIGYVVAIFSSLFASNPGLSVAGYNQSLSLC